MGGHESARAGNDCHGKQNAAERPARSQAPRVASQRRPLTLRERDSSDAREPEGHHGFFLGIIQKTLYNQSVALALRLLQPVRHVKPLARRNAGLTRPPSGRAIASLGVFGS